jgi:uncharacterized membrane protein YqjE
MPHQTPLNELPMKLNHANHNDGSTRDIAKAVANMVHDITELVELQFRLLSTDLRATRRQVMLPIVLLALVVCLLSGVTQLLLFALVNLLSGDFELSQLTAFAYVSAGTLLVAGALAAVALWRLNSCGQPLDNSKLELQRNLLSIKHILKSGGLNMDLRPKSQVD